VNTSSSLDDTTDLGRNFYLVLSQAVPISRGQNHDPVGGHRSIGSVFTAFGGKMALGGSTKLPEWQQRHQPQLSKKAPIALLGPIRRPSASTW